VDNREIKEWRLMKNHFNLMLVIVLVAMLIATFIGCGSSGSDPGDAIRGALNAMEELDAERMATYFAEDVRGDVELGMTFAFSLIDDMEISGIEIEILSQSEDAATARFEAYVKTTSFGQTEEGPMEQTLDLVKENGRWLINEFSIFD
jgi:hypothetical protein